jgi:hypothetical protein
VEGKTDAIPWYVALGQALICILLPITFLFPDQDRHSTRAILAGVIFISFGCLVIVAVELSRGVRVKVFPVLISLIASEIAFIEAFARIYKITGLRSGEGPITDTGDFIYFSMITWTTVGYGDIVPSPDGRLWAAAEALISYFTLALFIGAFARLFGQVATGPKPPRQAAG